MIEINLVPDVKQELIHAQRVRMSVISLSILISLIAAGVIVVLALLYGVEAVRNTMLDNSIKTNSSKLSKVTDINKTLTIQNQLTQLTQVHDSSHVNSRIFGVLVPISAQNTPNQIQYSTVTIDTEEDVVTVQAQTANYNGLNAFQKTLEATKFQYTTAGDSTTQTVNLASDIQVANQTLGQGADGGQSVSFTLSFKYPPELLAPSSENAHIVTPSSTNATDSYQGIPTSLFTQKTGGAQ